MWIKQDIQEVFFRGLGMRMGQKHLTFVSIFLFLPDITSTPLTRGYTSFTAFFLSPELKTYCGFLQSTKADGS